MEAAFARSWKRALSPHVVRAEAVNAVLALSAFSSGPLAALANGEKPKTRKADSRMGKRRRIRFDCCFNPALKDMMSLHKVR